MSQKLIIILILIIAILLVVLDIFSLNASYTYLIESTHAFSPFIFDKCIKYSTISEMFFTVFATLVGISAIFLSLGFLIAYETFTERILKSFFYFNYYLFGPFMLSCCVLGLLNFQKIGYACEDNNPNYTYLNLSFIVSLIIVLIIGTVITSAFSSMNMFQYFSDSIRFTKDGSYLLGKTFWKYIFSRNRISINH